MLAWEHVCVLVAAREVFCSWQAGRCLRWNGVKCHDMPLLSVRGVHLLS